MKDFKKLKQRVKPVVLEDVAKKVEKLGKKVDGIELMIIRTRAMLLNLIKTLKGVIV